MVLSETNMIREEEEEEEGGFEFKICKKNYLCN